MCVLPEPLSWTNVVPCTVLGTSRLLTAAVVDPQATPTVMSAATRSPSRWAAATATRSSRSTSCVSSGTGTTCAVTAKRSARRSSRQLGRGERRA